MHTYFSENRMLANRGPETSRLPDSADFRSMLSGIEGKITDMVNKALSPENRAQINRIVEGFNKEFSQVTSQLLADIRREAPKLKEYFRLGGQNAASAGRYVWDDQMRRLEALGRRNTQPQRYDIPVGDGEYTSASYTDDDGNVDILELHGAGEVYLYKVGADSYGIDSSGMQKLLADTLADNRRYSAERSNVLTGSLAQLEALKAKIDTRPVTPSAATASDTARTETPATPRTNLEPLPGETREAQRARLETALANARTAFNAQKDVVDRLIAAGAATPADQLKTEREKLIELEQAMIGIEGQITALRGERVSDTPQPT